MTQADSAHALRMSLDSDPIPGQGQAADIDATTPLPDGWGHFMSQPDLHAQTPLDGRWYASHPRLLNNELRHAQKWDRELARKLSQTVEAPTYIELCAKVWEQERLFRAVMYGAAL